MDDYDFDLENDDIELDVDDEIEAEFEDSYDDPEMSAYEMSGDEDDDDPEGDVDEALYSMMNESEPSEGEYPELIGYGIAKLIQKRKAKKKREKQRNARMKRQVKRANTASKVRKATLAAINRQLKANSRGIRTNTASLRRVNRSVINTSRRVSRVSSSVTKAHAVNRAQSKTLAQHVKIMKLDGALDFARGLSLTRTDKGVDVNVDFASLLQGAVKNKWIGQGKGFANSSTAVGVAGFLAQNFRALVPGTTNLRVTT